MNGSPNIPYTYHGCGIIHTVDTDGVPYLNDGVSMSALGPYETRRSIFDHVEIITEVLALEVLNQDTSKKTASSILKYMSPQTEKVAEVILNLHPSLWREIEPNHKWSFCLTDAFQKINKLDNM